MSIPLQNGIVQELTLVVSQSMASDFTSNAQDVRFFQLGSMQIQYSGNNASDGYFRPQVSVDQECWCDLLAAADWASTDTGDDCAFYAFDVAPFPYMRLFYDSGSNTTGSFIVKTFFKKANTN